MGLDEYYKWFQLPEGRRIQFMQMNMVGQARIYWRNLKATAERRRETALTTWAEMKGRLREKYIPACYRPMIIDEWQHLQQGDGIVVEYIARFDDLMIRCNIDEELVATLARFRDGLRPEYQLELVLHEVTTLEKAYRYTTNMELYSSHAQRAGYTWFSSPEQTQARHAILETTTPPHPPPIPSQPISHGPPSPTATPSTPPAAPCHARDLPPIRERGLRKSSREFDKSATPPNYTPYTPGH